MISAATEGVRRISPGLVPIRDRGDRRSQKKFPELESPDDDTDEGKVVPSDSDRSPTPEPKRPPLRDPDARIDIRVAAAELSEVEWTGLQPLPSTSENILIH